MHKYTVDVYTRSPRRYVKSATVNAKNDDNARMLAEALCNLNAIRFSYEIVSEEPGVDEYERVLAAPFRRNQSELDGR